MVNPEKRARQISARLIKELPIPIRGAAAGSFDEKAIALRIDSIHRLHNRVRELRSVTGTFGTGSIEFR